jgi:hypothetical protein
VKRERSRRCNSDPGFAGISAFASFVPLFIIEWEGRQRSEEPEDLPENNSSKHSVVSSQGKSLTTNYRFLSTFRYFPAEEGEDEVKQGAILKAYCFGDFLFSGDIDCKSVTHIIQKLHNQFAPERE